MTTPSTAELALLNTRPQSTKLYLSVYQPETVFFARVTGSVSKGDTTIPIYSVGGDPNLVEPEMFTMLVGTSGGDDDKGRIRVRTASNTQITVPINSHIDWQPFDYLTIIRYVEINPVYQRIIQDPSDAMNTLWYKFSDVAYTNQNSVLGTFICMGGHFAGFMEGSQCNVFYSASGTFNLKNEAMTYDWFFQGATVTGSSSQTPGNISYTTPGQYMTRLTVTTAGGASDTSYRFISVYQRPEDGVNNPILKWNLTNLSGRRENGGYSASIRVWGSATESRIKDNALVVIYADDRYGDTKQSIGGNSCGRSNIVFSGYILAGTVQYNYKEGFVDFDIGSPTEVMTKMDAFAIDVTSSTDPAGQAATDENYPSGWTLLLDMDCRRAIYHYLRWHSTVLFCNDFDVTHFGTDQAIEHFTSDRTSLYDAVNTLMQGTLLGEVVSDRQGRIYAEVATYATNNASGSFVTCMQLTKPLWMGEPVIDEKHIAGTSFIEMGGVHYDGPTAGTYLPLMACAPGNEPGLRGKMEQQQGLALTDQSQLNTLVGNIYAWKNSRYPNIDYRLVGNYRNLDIAPQELVSVTMDRIDTPRGLVFNQKPFAVRGMSWTYDSENELLLPILSVAEITQGFDGDTITIPPLPPVGPDNPPGPGFGQPPIVVPPIPGPAPVAGGTIPYMTLQYERMTVSSPDGATPFVIDAGCTRTNTNVFTGQKFLSMGTYILDVAVRAVSGTGSAAFSIEAYYGPCRGYTYRNAVQNADGYVTHAGAMAAADGTAEFTAVIPIHIGVGGVQGLNQSFSSIAIKIISTGVGAPPVTVTASASLAIFALSTSGLGCSQCPPPEGG